jgi:hypothetical protein
MKYLVLLFIPIVMSGQMLKYTEMHKINTQLLQYQYSVQKNKLISLSPVERVKITFKTGLNTSSVTSKIDVGSLLDGKFKNAFSDIDSYDYIGVISYDLRIKYYISDRARLLARAQFMGVRSNMYSIGVSFKNKSKTKKKPIEF